MIAVVRRHPGRERGRNRVPAARYASTVEARTVGPGATGASGPGAAGPVHRALADEVGRLRAARPGRRPRVLDVGGGSGAWAVPLARLGCAVTVVDNSPNALAALQRRARDAGVPDLVSAVQGDVDALAEAAPGDGADLVLGHGLLEVVDDAASAVAALGQAVAPGSAVSVLVAGRYAAVLSRALAGRLAEARALLTDPDGRFGPQDGLRRRLDVATLRALLESGGLRVELLQGDGVLEGWVPGSVRDGGPAAADALTELDELAAAAQPLRDVAARLHALARRPAPGS
jgi:S-adenosylmethionine-dependent methyltransferase